MSESGRSRSSVSAVEGVILLDKPAGISSNAALQSVRRLFDRPKAGHTGTLDPLATGLLAICLGETTKFAGVSLVADKTYQAALRLGVATSTGDAAGDTVFEGPLEGCLERLPAVLVGFRGEFEQLPPMFSALKHKGQPLYKYARAGTDVERSPRRVSVHRLDVLSASIQEVTIEVWCSKGTYIRTLAHDIGMQLGCGAHLATLRRTRIGELDVRDALTLDGLALLPLPQRIKQIWPSDLILGDLPAVGLDAQSAAAVMQGRTVQAAPGMPRGTVRLYDEEGGFLGLGFAEEAGRVVPKRMCSRRLPGIAQTGRILLERSAAQSLK